MIDTSTTLIRVVEQLTKITNSLEQMAAASSKQSAYQAQADKYREDYQKRQAAPQADKESKDSKTGFLKSLGDKIFGLTAPSTLNSNEKQRFTNIAKCFNAVMRVDAISKSIDRLRESNEEALEQRKRESLFSRLTPKAAKTEEKKESKGSILGSLLKWGLIAAALKLLWDLATAPLNALSGLWEFLSKWSLVGLIKLIKFKIMMFFNAITYPLKLLYKLLGGDSIDNAIKKVTGKLGEWAGKLKTFMFEVFEGLGERISKKIGQWIGRFKNFMFEAFEGMGERISKMMGSAQKYLMEKFPKLASNLSSIRSVVSESIDSIINWVKKPFQGISTAIMEFFAKKGGGEVAKVAATKLEGSLISKIFKGSLKFLGKLSLSVLRKIPGPGTLISFYFAYKRYKQGDHTGALIELISGLAGSTGFGMVLSIGLDMLNVWRDMSGRTAEEVKKNGPTNNWFTKMVDGFGKWASENLYNWPYVGSLIRSIEHFEADRWKEGFISLANAFPLVGGLLAMFDIKETESQAGRGTGNFSIALKSAWQWTKDLIRSIPVIGNTIKAFELFVSGKFSDGLSELGLGGIINAIKNFKFEMPSFGSIGEQLKGAVTWLGDTITNLPVIGNVIRGFKKFFTGNFAEGLSELGLSSIINGIKNLKFTMPSLGDIGDSLKNSLTWLGDTILNLPVIGNVIRAFKHFFGGRFADGFSELGLSSVINAIKNFKFEMPSFGDVGDKLSNAIKYLYDSILDLPIIRNIVQSIKYAASGEFKKAALELLPNGVVSWFKKLGGDTSTTKEATPIPASKSQPNQIKFDQASTNNLTPQSQKLQLAGLSDLQESLMAMSKQEINLLAEQRNLIRYTNEILTLIYNNSITPTDQTTPQQIMPGGQSTATGEPASVTRGAFQNGKNIMNMGMQGTLG